ncbi:hypothetical protein M422DRAFT_239114 [Sphaerobolus stellatus SS14]|nr:hypothetical protein M422DRAFT_239114 [Sphaerobolus stellatus SS14]
MGENGEKSTPNYCIQLSSQSSPPEDIPLNLPSSFPLCEHLLLEILEAGQIERKLHEVNAHSAIQQLKDALTKKVANLNACWQHVVEQSAATCAAKLINGQVKVIEKYAENYRRIRDRMLSLGMPEDHPDFKVLRREDCESKRMWASHETHYAKYSRKVKTVNEKGLSWIWLMGKKSETLSGEWRTETQRVHWFVAQAQMKWWKEEVEIVEEEMRRVIRFFKFYENIWIKLAEEHHDQQHSTSYCMGMISEYRRLQEDAYRCIPAYIYLEEDHWLTQGNKTRNNIPKLNSVQHV